MAQQKIRVNTALELDDEVYNITIIPVTKKTAKKIQKEFNKEKDSSKEYIALEEELAIVEADIELTQELLDATEDLADKRGLIKDKRDFTVKKRELSKKIEEKRTEVFERIQEAKEKMFKSMFEEMVSGEDAEKLKTYVSEFSFETAIEKVSAVYTEEIEGK